MKSSHSSGRNVDPLHSIWLLAFGLYGISYINAAFAEGGIKGLMNDEWTDGKRGRMEMKDGSLSEPLHLHPS